MFYFKALSAKVSAYSGCILACMIFNACKPDIKENTAAQKYFDVAGFFRQDAARLNHLQPAVLKSVTHNNNTESKIVKINNWGSELDFFISSDINKPAWRDSYTITGGDGFLLYKAKDPDLKMRELLIKKTRSVIKWILIFNRTRNKLYQSQEKLTYYPDSLYIIEESQRVRFLGTNNYKIQGLIKK